MKFLLGYYVGGNFVSTNEDKNNVKWFIKVTNCGTPVYSHDKRLLGSLSMLRNSLKRGFRISAISKKSDITSSSPLNNAHISSNVVYGQMWTQLVKFYWVSKLFISQMPSEFSRSFHPEIQLKYPNRTLQIIKIVAFPKKALPLIGSLTPVGHRYLLTVKLDLLYVVVWMSFCQPFEMVEEFDFNSLILLFTLLKLIICK